jgi:hypothetical protein
MQMTAPRSAVAIWLTAIFVGCGSDSSGPPTGPSVAPDCQTVQLLPGEDAIFEGAAAVNCLDLPAYEARTEYESWSVRWPERSASVRWSCGCRRSAARG